MKFLYPFLYILFIFVSVNTSPFLEYFKTGFSLKYYQILPRNKSQEQFYRIYASLIEKQKGVSTLYLTFIINQVSTITALDWKLIIAMIQIESNFRPDVKSKRTKLYYDKKYESAIGLMQVKPSTAKEVCEKYNIRYYKDVLYNAYYNVLIGSLYLRDRIIKHKNLILGIKAYNVGDYSIKRGVNPEIFGNRVLKAMDSLI